MSILKRERERIRVLEQLGYTVELSERGGKHNKIWATTPSGKQVLFVTSVTPSDWRTEVAWKAQARRYLRN